MKNTIQMQMQEEHPAVTPKQEPYTDWGVVIIMGFFSLVLIAEIYFNRNK